MLGTFALPMAAAQPSANAQTDVQASADTGIMTTLQSIQEQLDQIQQRLTSIEQRLSEIEARQEARVEAKGQATATGELNSNGNSPPEHAQNNENLGAQVSAEARAGDREGIMAAISSFLSARGNNNAADAVGNNSDADETGAELQVNVSGDVEAGNNVTVTVTQGGEPVENASVDVNGEIAGKTGADGELVVTVPDEDEFEVKVTSGEAEAELEYDLQAEASADASAGTETSTDSDGSSNTSAEAEASISAEIS